MTSDRAEMVPEEGQDGDPGAEQPPAEASGNRPGLEWSDDERPWVEHRPPSEDHPRPVLIEDEPQRLVVRSPARTGLGLLAITGATVTLLGAIDILLMWFPLGFGVPAWQFGTLTRTFELAPEIGLGTALLAYSVVRYPDVEPQVVRGVGIAFGALGVLVLLGAGLYAASVPDVLAEAAAQARAPLLRSVIRTSAVVLICVAACAALVWRLWHSVREE